MPRQARLDAPGTLHHIMIRGIEKQKIVDDRKDRQDFIDYMGQTALENDIKIFAFALMTNHAHILLKSGKPGLSKYMRRFLTRYAGAYNRRHNRHGYLFQNRYKSLVCEEDTYFQELVRYIHLNPLRAGLVKTLSELDSYAFCGHSCLMGNRNYEWQDWNYVLKCFGKTTEEAKKAYRLYMKEGLSQGNRPELVGGRMVRSSGKWSSEKSHRSDLKKGKKDLRILGSSAFVERVIKEADEKVKHHLPANKLLEKIPKMIAEFCRAQGVGLQELRSGSRRGNLPEVRQEIALRLIREHGITLAEAGRQLGLTMSAVSKMVSRSELR